jgi:hypothetical protein
MIPFSGNPPNRAIEKRTDSDWIEAKRRDPSSLVLPMWRLEPFLPEPEKSGSAVDLGLLRLGIVDSVVGAGAPSIFSGSRSDRAVFALDLSEAADIANAGPLARFGYFRDTRMAARRSCSPNKGWRSRC